MCIGSQERCAGGVHGLCAYAHVCKWWDSCSAITLLEHSTEALSRDPKSSIRSPGHLGDPSAITARSALEQPASLHPGPMQAPNSLQMSPGLPLERQRDSLPTKPSCLRAH